MHPPATALTSDAKKKTGELTIDDLTGGGHDVRSASQRTGVGIPPSPPIPISHFYFYFMDRKDIVVAAAEGTRESPKDSNSRRAAACLVCRRSKIKCEKGRAHNDDRCQRCLQLGVQCVRPDFHVGRRKGVKK